MFCSILSCFVTSYNIRLLTQFLFITQCITTAQSYDWDTFLLSSCFAYLSIVLTKDPLFSIIRWSIVAVGYCSCDLLFVLLLLFSWWLLFSLPYCSLRVYSQALWVACSLRLDFLYPTVMEPIELEVLLFICLLAAHHLSHPPSRTLSVDKA